jgi:hypothetical protein
MLDEWVSEWVSVLNWYVFVVCVQTLTGRKQAYNVEMEQTVSITLIPPFCLSIISCGGVILWHIHIHAHDLQVLELKESLQEKENIALDQLRLIFSGKQL